jgi:phosphatidylglycerol---prolipoprotein diacylglyceryl transferase
VFHLYGLIIGISFVIGINYFSKHNTIVPKAKENLFILLLFIFSVIGARLYHVIDQHQYYSQHPIQILQTWNGGLGIYGGLIFGLIFIFLFSKIYHLNFLNILDTITPIVPLCQAVGRLGNFFNHEIPTWWLEASLNLILFFFLRRSPKPSAHYLIGYGLIRFSVEFFRFDTWQLGSLKIAQLISLISVISGIWLLSHHHTKSGNK